MSCPIVGVGASAGGLEAYTQLLRELPPHTGMAFVLLQHLDPTHASLLPDLLARETEMAVVEARDAMAIAPDCVYVLPAGASLAVEQGVLALLPRTDDGGLHMPIDRFFQSLAEDRGAAAIGVLLSGSGSDGTQGLRAIRAAGGITLVQEPKSARHDGMPRSAIAALVVDHVLAPQEIARKLAHLADHSYLRPATRASRTPGPLEADDAFQVILGRILETTGVDFRCYKRSTLQRRIARRLAVHEINDLNRYVQYLAEHPEEVRALYEDILIHVTGFFHDPEAFEALACQAFPEVLKRKGAGDPIRIWVPGCSTGEEAYSITICLLEFLEQAGRNVPIKLFASDISDEALARARAGLYAESIRRDIPDARLERFFVRSHGGYRISKRIRDLCTFVKHDLSRDPPFSRLDLISCRNVLIYPGSDLQATAVPIFHYALNPEGYLFLGRSETINGFSHLFRLVDRSSKILVRRPGPTVPRVGFAMGAVAPAKRRIEVPAVSGGLDLHQKADAILLARYAPPGVVVNGEMRILQFRGHTGDYLEPAPGEADLSLLKMAREGLVSDLRLAVHTAKKTDAPVRREGLRLRTRGETRTVAIEVLPVPPSPADARERCFLVLFEEDHLTRVPALKPPKRRGGRRGEADSRSAPEREVTRLREELASTKDYLQSLIEQYETVNAELNSTNEELQSTNEELHTTNEELERRNQDLGQLSSDLTNLMASASIAIVMLGHDRRIRRFTPRAARLFNLVPADVGRPIDDLRHNLNLDYLDTLTMEVLDTTTIQEREVQDNLGRWYQMQLRPYRTLDDKVDGCVLVLIDITTLKQAEQMLRFLAEASRQLSASLDYETTLANVARLAVPDLADRCWIDLLEADQSFRRLVVAYADPAKAALAEELARRYPEQPSWPASMPDVARTGQPDVVSEVPDSTLVAIARDAEHLALLRKLALRSYVCVPLVARGRTLGTVTFASGAPERRYGPTDVGLMEELARRVALAVENSRLYLEAQAAITARDNFLGRAAHEVRTPLTVVKGHLALLAKGPAAQDAATANLISTARRQVDRMNQLLSDLLDASRLAADRMPWSAEPLDLHAVIAEGVSHAMPVGHEKGVAVVNAVNEPLPIRGDPLKLEQVMVNLIVNAIKYTPAGGTVRVEATTTGAVVQVRVRDTGVGLAREHLERIFEPFFQVESAIGRRKAAGRGSGLGLAIVRQFVGLHGGRVWAESDGPGLGSTFVVTLPRAVAPRT